MIYIGVIMEIERTISFQLSQRLTDEELQQISAAGSTIATRNCTYNPKALDPSNDISYDF